MELAKGTKLSYINEPGSVTLVKVLAGNKLLVEDEYGFEITVASNQLMTQQGKLLTALQSEEVGEDRKPHPTTKQAWPRGVQSVSTQEVVVDLHLEELCDAGEERFISHPLELQLKTLRKTMTCAREHRIKQVIVIHGKGRGVLRQEVLHLLSQAPNLEYWDASFEEYGGGAICVRLYGISK